MTKAVKLCLCGTAHDAVNRTDAIIEKQIGDKECPIFIYGMAVTYLNMAAELMMATNDASIMPVNRAADTIHRQIHDVLGLDMEWRDRLNAALKRRLEVDEQEKKLN